MMKVALVPKSQQDMRFLLKRLRSAYVSGLLPGLIIALAASNLEKNFAQRDYFSLFCNVALLLVTGVGCYRGWKSHKCDCDDLAQLIAQQERGDADTP